MTLLFWECGWLCCWKVQPSCPPSGRWRRSVRSRSWSVPPGPAPCREKAHIITQVIIYEHVHYSVRFHMYGHILLTTEMYIYQGYRGSLNMYTLRRISAACWWSPVTTDLLNHIVFLCILTARLQHYKSNIQTWSISAMHAYIWTQQTGMLCMA